MASESPLDQFVLMPDVPLDLRAAAVFLFDISGEDAISWLVQTGSHDGLLPAGVSLGHDFESDSLPPSGAARR